MPYKDKEKQREYQRQWMLQRRAIWLADNGPCVDCGTWADLEVDHVDPSQKVSHRVWSWTEASREAELAKCVVRCQPCHLIKTLAARTPASHGVSRYKLYQCRCEICIEAKRVENARRKR